MSSEEENTIDAELSKEIGGMVIKAVHNDPERIMKVMEMTTALLMTFFNKNVDTYKSMLDTHDRRMRTLVNGIGNIEQEEQSAPNNIVLHYGH